MKVSASKIADKFGFTARHWIRQAAKRWTQLRRDFYIWRNRR
jgi:hypothetical protein